MIKINNKPYENEVIKDKTICGMRHISVEIESESVCLNEESLIEVEGELLEAVVMFPSTLNGKTSFIAFIKSLERR